MAAAANTPLELIEGVYAKLAERTLIGHSVRLGTRLSVAASYSA